MGARGKQSLAPRAEEATLSRTALGKIVNLSSQGLILSWNYLTKWFSILKGNRTDFLHSWHSFIGELKLKFLFSKSDLRLIFLDLILEIYAGRILIISIISKISAPGYIIYNSWILSKIRRKDSLKKIYAYFLYIYYIFSRYLSILYIFVLYGYTSLVFSLII